MHPDWARSLRDQCASDGNQYSDDKLYAGRVRAVRRFKAHPLTT
jgi:hypothetical protein